VLAVLAAGCAGGSEPRSADYREQAARLCAQAALAGERDPVAAAQRRRRLLDLVPPPELAAAHAELRAVAGTIERVGASASLGRVSPARALERIDRLEARVRRTYRAMGVPACG